ncbi:MAG: HD-GYP domain-containing protein, partial [Candidatus Omnitrophica bacterium]|nr:HD-GYP domain-containing protein [Candidatus Omnitrophota bacterium]
PISVGVIDSLGNFIEIKIGKENTFPFNSLDTIGRNIRDIGLPSKFSSLWENCLKKIFENSFVQTLEFDFFKNGQTEFYEISFVPLDKQRVIFISRNVSRYKFVEKQLAQSLEKLQRILRETIRALASAVEKRDPYTAGHQQRVTYLASSIAQKLKFSEEKLNGLQLASLIHDVGKMYVPAEILSKPTMLSEIEFNLIKAHPQVGYYILHSVEFPWPIDRIVLQHHERLDGSGYPFGISKEEILMEAKIIAVADVVEAMASHRPYRPSLGIDRALEEISINQGILFDKQVVEICIELFRKENFSFPS